MYWFLSSSPSVQPNKLGTLYLLLCTHQYSVEMDMTQRSSPTVTEMVQYMSSLRSNTTALAACLLSKRAPAWRILMVAECNGPRCLYNHHLETNIM